MRSASRVYRRFYWLEEETMQLKWEPSKKDSDKARVLVQLGFRINVVYIKNWPSQFSQNFQFLKVPFHKKSIPRRFDFSKSRFPEKSIPRRFDFSKSRFPEILISRSFDYPKIWLHGKSSHFRRRLNLKTIWRIFMKFEVGRILKFFFLLIRQNIFQKNALFQLFMEKIILLWI